VLEFVSDVIGIGTGISCGNIHQRGLIFNDVGRKKQEGSVGCVEHPVLWQK